MRKLYASLLIAAVLAAGALSTGCAVTGSSPAATVFAAHSNYDAALTGALTYKKLPDCAVTTSKICSDKEVVTTLQKADNVAFEALSSAQTIVRKPKTTQSSLETAAMWAKEAIAAFAKVVASLKRE